MDSKDGQQGMVCQFHPGSAVHCGKLTDMLLRWYFFFPFENLKKGDPRDGLSFSFMS